MLCSDENVVSVIIPVYNTAEYLPQCIESVLAQSYESLEIVIIDDGSTDASGQIIDQYAASDSRIIAIHQENCGLVQTRKIGLEIASGTYVGFVDSDDWIDRGMYQYLVETMLTHKADVVTSGRFVETGITQEVLDDFVPGVYSPIQDASFCERMIWTKEKSLWGIAPNFWNKLFLRERLIEFEAKVDNQITYGEDDACVYPYMAYARKLVVTDKSFYHYRVRNTSMSSSADDYYFDRINKLYLVLKKQFEKHPQSEVLLHELGLYMAEFAIRGINGLWGLKTNIVIPRYQMDLSFLLTSQKAVLYGAGKVGRELHQVLERQGLLKHVIWVDKQYLNYQAQGLDVHSISEIKEMDYSSIMVAVYEKELFESIREELIAAGIKRDRIVWFKNSMKSIFGGDRA
jgi:glycosyltransferase involved in cell wall biosynthesis